MDADVRDSGGGIVTVRLSGTLTESVLRDAQEKMAAIIRAHGTVAILVLADAFTGWSRGEAWDDLSFQLEFDASIRKMAIVGDRRWEQPALVFAAKGLRRFPIEYFSSSELDQARAWLEDPA